MEATWVWTSTFHGAPIMSLHMSVLVAGAVMLSGGLVPSSGGAQAGPLSADRCRVSYRSPLGRSSTTAALEPEAPAALRYSPETVSWLGIRFELSGLPSSSHDPGGDAESSNGKIENRTSTLFATTSPEARHPSRAQAFLHDSDRWCRASVGSIGRGTCMGGPDGISSQRRGPRTRYKISPGVATAASLRCHCRLRSRRASASGITISVA